MTSINLATDKEENRMLGTGVSILFLIFLLIMLAYLALFFYGKKIDKDITSLDEACEVSYKSFVSGDALKVLDFQNRLVTSKEILNRERNMNKDIEKVESAMIKGVYLDSYEYDGTTGEIKLNCNADNYEIIAKQIFSFKSSNYFLVSSAGDSKFNGETGKISFPVILTAINK